MHRSTLRVLVSALPLWAGLACSHSKSSPTPEQLVGSCDVAANGPAQAHCQDAYVQPAVSLTPDELANLATQVGALCAGGTWTEAQPCATANRAGTCAYDLSPADTGLAIPLSMLERYYDASLTASDAGFCASIGGVWTAP